MAQVPSEAAAKVADLVERFERNVDQYRRGEYKEAEVRQEFIDPFFDALGWDVRNRGGYAEAYKDVVHEESLRVAAGIEAPDYTFRIGGTRKFFVEAKKPSVSVKTDVGPAYQLRRYAWSAHLPLSILTDFEEFAVYDCTRRPNASDKASVGRVAFHTFEQYAEKLPDIWDTFAKDSVLRGSFDRYVESTKGKRGTGEVDDEILREIEGWRDSLAHNLALRNPNLSVDELNFAVQATIDRILFLRVAEDRGIEDYGRLQVLLNGANIYPRLGELFAQADRKYNAGLFDFRADALSLRLHLDDKVLKDILGRLYYPDSPYEFSVMPVEILGQVYEQFLGKVIRLTPGHQAKVEEKPEVKKAGGVYYTPKYVVDYIVHHTVGELVNDRSPADLTGQSRAVRPVRDGVTRHGSRVASGQSRTKDDSSLATRHSPLRVLDPACGSGSFLLGAYDYLLTHCLDWYSAHDPDKWAASREPPIRRGGNGDWKLTIAERKRILVTHIFGVDIDRQAVEVTKLSLLLKVLEGESQETLGQQLRLFQERALPNLDHNIQCGNSLIGPDYWEGRLVVDPDEARRVNAFDWHAAFPDVFRGTETPLAQSSRGRGLPTGVPQQAGVGREGGFDAVIGNPPYVRVRVFKEFYPEQVAYLERHYCCATHVWDVYLLFLERAMLLARTGGRVGFIVPIQTLHQPNCESLRQLLLEEHTVRVVADLSRLRVFEGPTVKNCVLVVERGRSANAYLSVLRPDTAEHLLSEPGSDWPQDAARRNPGWSLKVDLLSPTTQLCEKLRSRSWRLDELCYVTFGLRSCAPGKGQGTKDRLVTIDRRAENAKPYLEGRDIDRYETRPTGRYIRYHPREMYSPRTPALFESKKMVSRSMLSRMQLVATLDEDGYYVEQSLVCIIPHGLLTDAVAVQMPLEFVLGMLNSRLESFYFATELIDYSLGGGLVHATPGTQGRLLVPKASSREVERTVALVERMLDLHKRQAAARTPADRDLYAHQIAATDKEIDALVYELYGLTEGEIAVVEGSATR